MVTGASSKRRSLVATSSYDSSRSQMLKAREEHARNQKRDYSHVFRKKTRFELIRISCIITGIEFAYAAETAFVSPILLGIGIEHQHMTMVWGISPLLGFFLAPIIGSLSDRCRLSWGRRRPIILLLTIGLLSGLILAPYGKTFGEMMGEGRSEVAKNESLGNFTEEYLESTNSPIKNVTESFTTLLPNTISNFKGNIQENNTTELPTLLNTISTEFISSTDFQSTLEDTIKESVNSTVSLTTLDSTQSFTESLNITELPLAQEVTEFMNLTSLENTPIEFSNSTDLPLKSVVTRSVSHQDSYSNYYWAIILTIMGTVLLDFNADNIQSPARAYLLDMCINEDHARALSTFSIMAGTGGSLGYALGAVDWEKTFLTNFVGDNIKTVFALVTVIFILTTITTLTSFREIPLKLLEFDEMLRPLTNAAMKREREIRMKVIEDEAKALMEKKDPRNINNNDESSDDESGDEDDDKPVSFTQYLKSIVIMPKSMKILCLTNLFCWMCHLCYCLYFTDFVGEAVFHGDPTAPIGSDEYIRYEEGVRFGCLGMSIYALTCAIYAMFIEKLIEKFKAKRVFIGGMLSYAIAIGILGFWPTKWGVLVFSTTAGIVYATVFTIPFMLVANYHGKGSFKVKKGVTIESFDHGRGLGTDIAIVGSMLFLAQIFVSLSVGWFVSLLSSTSAVLYAASLFSFLATVSANFCVYMDL